MASACLPFVGPDRKLMIRSYSSVSFQGWGGASGHDAPLIAYDALLGAGDNWIELALRGILHGGDNDSVRAPPRVTSRDVNDRLV